MTTYFIICVSTNRKLQSDTHRFNIILSPKTTLVNPIITFFHFTLSTRTRLLQNPISTFARALSSPYHIYLSIVFINILVNMMMFFLPWPARFVALNVFWFLLCKSCRFAVITHLIRVINTVYGFLLRSRFVNCIRLPTHTKPHLPTPRKSKFI